MRIKKVSANLRIIFNKTLVEYKKSFQLLVRQYLYIYLSFAFAQLFVVKKLKKLSLRSSFGQ